METDWKEDSPARTLVSEYLGKFTLIKIMNFSTCQWNLISPIYAWERNKWNIWRTKQIYLGPIQKFTLTAWLTISSTSAWPNELNVELLVLISPLGESEKSQVKIKFATSCSFNREIRISAVTRWNIASLISRGTRFRIAEWHANDTQRNYIAPIMRCAAAGCTCYSFTLFHCTMHQCSWYPGEFRWYRDVCTHLRTPVCHVNLAHVSTTTQEEEPSSRA